MKIKSVREGNTGSRGKMAMNKYVPIITLNVNGLNAPVKRNRVAEWIRKHNPHTCCQQETHLR